VNRQSIINNYLRKTLNWLKAAVCAAVMTIFILAPLLTDNALASSAGSFTQRPNDARSFGVGSATAALSQYGSASYWNPAALGFVRSSELSSMQSTILGDVNYMTLGYNHLAEASFWDIAWGVNLVNVRVEDIKEAVYDISNDSAWLTGDTFGYYGNAIVLSAAKTFSSRLSVGLNLKHIQEQLDNNSASGTGLDAGLIYKLNSRTNIGMVFQNTVAPQLAWDTGSSTVEKMASNLVFGLSYQVDRRFLLSFDANVRTDRGLEGRFGGEYRLNDYFTLRAGYDQQRLVMGTSIYYKQFGVHYTYAPEPVGQAVDTKHYLSISYALEEGYLPQLKDEEEEEEKKEGQKAPAEVTAAAGTLRLTAETPTKAVEEIVIEEETEIRIEKISVKKSGALIRTNVDLTNTGEVTANILTSLSIYDKEMLPLKVFTAKALTLGPQKTGTNYFEWRYMAELPYGSIYYFKARVAYSSKEQSVTKKVIRK
jgi:hypothetical protein